ncbi:MAG: chemotaxis protein CheW [Candidatus Melainabacteria bacterium]|nr:chemotaxis protein CheW [Candidatus Melainabacteria bacterium]
MPAKSFVSFHLGDQLFGIDICQVREINRHLHLTPVPLAPNYVRGLVNLRGQIITVLDLKERLGLGQTEMSDISHNIILKTDSEQGISKPDKDSSSIISEKVGFWVDAIGNVISLDTTEIDPPPANMGEVDGKYLFGVVKLENTLMSILSIAKILNGKVDE